MLEEQLTELCQNLGHLLGGALAFILVRFTTISRLIAMVAGVGVALSIWFLSPAVLLGNWLSPDDEWFWAALIVHSGMAVTLAAMGAFLFKRRSG